MEPGIGTAAGAVCWLGGASPHGVRSHFLGIHMTSRETHNPSSLTLGLGLRQMFDLTARRALVTGASRGIGRAIAVGFAAFGADVLAVARSEDDLAETARLAEGLPGRIVPWSAD